MSDDGTVSLRLADWIKEKLMGGRCGIQNPKHIVLKYFTLEFPKLLIHTFNVMKECEDSHIKLYYNNI